MSYFVIIRGPLASGKSTLSEWLAKKLMAQHVRIDQALDKLGINEVDEVEGCILAASFMKAIESVLPEAKESLEKGQIVIFDGCFYHQEALEHLLGLLKFPHYVFTLKAPVELCIERDRQREKSYGEDATRAVHKLVSRFDYGTNIDVSESINQAIDNILTNLPDQ